MRVVAVVGRLGVSPMVQLSLPARRIVAYLAVQSQTVGRNVVASELWPDEPECVGRANLRRALWHIPPGWILSAGSDLTLEAECDLPRARQAASRALAGDALTLDEIALLSNDILPGWHEEWVQQPQESFHLLRVQSLEAACRTMASAGQYALATQAGAAAIAAEPLRESAAEALIDAHLAQRNRFEAMQCFKLLSQRLRAELGVSPDPALAQRLASIGLKQRAS